MQPPFGAHSDAQGLCHIGCRVAFRGVSTSRSHLPEWFAQLALSVEGESAIYLFELCDSILAAFAANALTLTDTRSCVFCIDNQAALAALINGPTSSEPGTALVGPFWALAARSPVQWGSSMCAPTQKTPTYRPDRATPQWGRYFRFAMGPSRWLSRRHSNRRMRFVGSPPVYDLVFLSYSPLLKKDSPRGLYYGGDFCLVYGPS